MKLKLIACEVLIREISWCVARSPHTIDMVFTPKGAHESGDLLRKTITEEIRKAEESYTEYDAILLGYGLCGNGTAGLSSSRYPLVLPRAHDCCTLFLGSKERFRELFSDNPSRPFSSAGYMERGESYLHESTVGAAMGLNRTYQDYVELYGEENARYIMETIKETEQSSCKELYFINVPETDLPVFRKKCREESETEGYTYTEQKGSIRLIENLLFGNWPEEDFQVLKPGEEFVPLYDWDRIIRSSGDNKQFS